MRRLEDGSFRALVQRVWVVDHSRLLISMGGGTAGSSLDQGSQRLQALGAQMPLHKDPQT